MGQVIVKLQDHYLIWSSIVDAPITMGMKRRAFANYYRKEYGELSFREEFETRMARADQNGTSAIPPMSVEDLVSHNRAGKGETCLTLKQITAEYIPQAPKQKEPNGRTSDQRRIPKR